MKKAVCTLVSLIICGIGAVPATAFPAGENSRFTSTFIQNWLCRDWTEKRWEEEFSAARASGFDSLIIQSVAEITYDVSNSAAAPECYCMFPSESITAYDFGNNPDVLAYALEAAKANGMTVWLGTVNDNSWWNYGWDTSTSAFEEWSRNNSALTSALIAEMWERYGADYGEQIAGWYYTNEIWNIESACNGTDNGSYAKIIANNINCNITAVNNVCPDKPVMISPFYNKDISTSQQYTAFLSNIINAADFRRTDIYAGQDGCGKGYSSDVIREWTIAQKNAVSGNMRFWINNECFSEDYTAVPVSKLREDFVAVSDLAEKNILFSWNHYYASDTDLNKQFTEFTFENIKGDVNGDGEFSSADLVRFQKWLLAVDDTRLVNWKAADLCEDSILDVIDLCAMRKALLISMSDNCTVVYDINELYDAVKNAKAGNVIKVAPGIYDCSAKIISSESNGTESSPITLEALYINDPPVLTGSATEHGYVLHILGDYWILDGLICTNSQKGIVLDNSNHSIIRNCELHTLGAEAIAIRDGSSYCAVDSCNIHDTGLVSPGYGEGVYIGSAKSTTGFDYKCDHNKVMNCTFRNVAAEHVDVKEYTTDTEIFGCAFYGDGMTGANYAGSFIDIKGNDCYVHDNVGYRNGNPEIVAAFEIHEQVEGWGYHHVFSGNSLYMDQPYGAKDTNRRMYVVDGWFSDFTVKNNMVDYGSGLVPADEPKFYNSDQVTFG